MSFVCLSFRIFQIFFHFLDDIHITVKEMIRQQSAIIIFCKPIEIASKRRLSPNIIPFQLILPPVFLLHF